MGFHHGKQFTPFFFYPAVALALLVAAWADRPPSPGAMMLLVLLGFGSWGVVEYVMHRFVFHDGAEDVRAALGAAHLAHHADPRSTTQLFAALRFSVPVAALYFALAWFALGNWQRAAHLFAGLIAGYLVYEVLHYRAHHVHPRLKLFRYLKRYHLLHHYRTPGARFGVTSPIFDYLCGTFRR